MVTLAKNMNRLDQAIRTVIGLALIYFGFVDPSFIGDRLYAVILGLFGVLNLMSAVVAFCPVYALAGISSLGKKHEAKG